MRKIDEEIEGEQIEKGKLIEPQEAQVGKIEQTFIPLIKSIVKEKYVSEIKGEKE